jgi:DNA-binding XRE family transcriptional regulator
MIIDQEFKTLIPSLAKEEYEGLEKSLLTEGCRENLIIWKEEDILLDGHNRYEICQAHNLIFQIKYISLPDRASAKIWIIRNQLNRRNITAYQRSELVLILEPMLREKAKENQREHGNTAPGQSKTLLQNSVEAIDTQKELAKAAGVSHDTIYKVKAIHEHGIEPLQDMARSGEISINTAAAIAKASEEEQKVIVGLPEKEIIAKAQELTMKYKAEAEAAKQEAAEAKKESATKQQLLFDQEERIKYQSAKLQELETERSSLEQERTRLRSELD